MSESKGGEDWWMASDGKWYPPAESETGDRAADPMPWWKRRWVLVVGALAAVAVVAGVVNGGTEDEQTTEPAPEVRAEDDANPSPDEVEPTAVAPTAEPTAAPTATARPTATPTPTPEPTATPTPVPFEPIVRSGTGNDVVTFDEPVDMALIARLSHTGSSNFQVTVFDENGDRVDSLANEIGDWSGEVPVNFRDGEQFSFMEITADGAWEISFDDLSSATVVGTESGTTYAGTGSEVLFFAAEGPTIIDVDCPSCDSNILISAHGDRRTGVANEIGDGGYSASHLIPSDTLVLHMDMRAGFRQGPPGWTISVQ